MRRLPLAVKLALPLVATVLVVAACASSGGSGGATGAGGAGGSTMVNTASGSAGTYLTDGSGRAVYVWMADSSNKSTCSGACASEWPPLTAASTPSAGNGVTASELGMITRDDGSKQVTYDGHPLYYYTGDSGAGQTNGQGSNQFGAQWWLVAPSGSPINGTGGGSTQAPTPSTGGGGGDVWS